MFWKSTFLFEPIRKALTQRTFSGAYLMSRTDQDTYRKHRKEALATVEKGTRALLKSGPLRTSPLVETTIRHDLREASDVTLVYYSDMEQNSMALSVYGKGSVQHTLDSPNLEQDSLKNVHVKVHRIVRRSPLGLFEATRLQGMWTSWFSRAEATTE